MKKKKTKKIRDFHKLAVLRGEALSTREQHHNEQSKYNRKKKHKAKYD